MVRIRELLAVLAFMVFMSGCNNMTGDGDKNTYEDDVHPGIKQLRDSLNEVGDGEAHLPNTIALSSSLHIPKDWNAVNAEIKETQKYVVLDMSACPVDGNKIPDNVGGSDIFGAATPAAGDMNIIHDNTYIKGLILPSGITEIGAYAFYKCVNLTTVIFPDSLTKIGKSAFASSWHLREINFPANITTIEEHAFSGVVCNRIIFEGATTVVDPTSFSYALWELYDKNGAGIYTNNFPSGWTYKPLDELESFFEYF